jgi:hypothetical protein
MLARLALSESDLDVMTANCRRSWASSRCSRRSTQPTSSPFAHPLDSKTCSATTCRRLTDHGRGAAVGPAARRRMLPRARRARRIGSGLSRPTVPMQRSRRTHATHPPPIWSPPSGRATSRPCNALRPFSIGSKPLDGSINAFLKFDREGALTPRPTDRRPSQGGQAARSPRWPAGGAQGRPLHRRPANHLRVEDAAGFRPPTTPTWSPGCGRPMR